MKSQINANSNNNTAGMDIQMFDNDCVTRARSGDLGALRILVQMVIAQTENGLAAIDSAVDAANNSRARSLPERPTAAGLTGGCQQSSTGSTDLIELARILRNADSSWDAAKERLVTLYDSIRL
jgi:hypothetical protein